MSLYRCTVTGIVMGQTCQNVFHMKDKGTPSAQPEQDLAADLLTNWINNVKTQQTNVFTWTNIKIQRVSGAPAQPFNLAISVVGSITGGTSFWTPAAIVLSLRSTMPGRVGRGRHYISGLKNDMIFNNLIAGVYLTSWQTVANNIIARFAPSGTSLFTLVISSRSNTAPDAAHEVLSITARSVIGCQRRRNTGVGI